jgi:uncharacterized membrane protein
MALALFLEYPLPNIKPISFKELLSVQIALIAAIILQTISWVLSPSLHFGPQYIIFAIEIALVTLIGITAKRRHLENNFFHRAFSMVLIGIITAANIGSLMLVLNELIRSDRIITGYELLASAVAIFLTNIIVFGLWYWEIDSPGLTGRSWTKNDKDFQFTQQDLPREFPSWQPVFLDYLYLSVTNAINFAAADAKPLTLQAKGLMGIQALVSVFTLALLIARSINILG